MSKKAPIDAVNAIHQALEGLDSQSQLQALQAAVTLLGTSAESIGISQRQADSDTTHAKTDMTAPSMRGSGGAIGAASAFFEAKDPQGLMEVLAVAARYRELAEAAEVHTKNELDAVFRAARRNPPTNFHRDLKNAKQQQYFNIGSDIVLSHYGQRHVDALPDRDAARAIARPRKPVGKKKRKSKAAAK
jgi:hypothetical protein